MFYSGSSDSDVGKEKVTDSPVVAIKSRPKSDFIKGKYSAVKWLKKKNCSGVCRIITSLGSVCIPVFVRRV